MQEDGIGTLTGYQHKFMSINSTRRYSSTGAARINPGHGTKNCKRMGLVQRYRLLFYQVYKFILSLAPQDVTAPELQEVSLYQFILI